LGSTGQRESRTNRKSLKNPGEIINQKKYKMTNKIITITTHLPAIPDWLKINSYITVPLPLKSAKELAQKLMEIRDDVEIELNFASGKKTTVEIKYESEDKD
jgi:hypothetical protein